MISAARHERLRTPVLLRQPRPSTERCDAESGRDADRARLRHEIVSAVILPGVRRNSCVGADVDARPTATYVPNLDHDEDGGGAAERGAQVSFDLQVTEKKYHA